MENKNYTILPKWKEKISIGVIGIDYSGADEVADFINSSATSLCPKDHLWNLQSSKIEAGSILDTDLVRNTTHKYHQFLMRSPHVHVAGMKEKFLHVPSQINRNIQQIYHEFDAYIFVTNDPVVNWSQWRKINQKGKSQIPLSLKFFTAAYFNCLRKSFQLNKNKPTVILNYPRLVKEINSGNGDRYLNNIMFQSPLPNGVTFRKLLEFKGTKNYHLPEIKKEDLPESEKNFIRFTIKKALKQQPSLTIPNVEDQELMIH